MEVWQHLKGTLLILSFAWHADSFYIYEGRPPFSSEVKVEFEQGTVIGHVVQYEPTVRSEHFFTAVIQFLGIPFAKPPVGPLRFKKPEPPQPFDGGIYLASNLPPGCVQYRSFTEPWQEGFVNPDWRGTFPWFEDGPTAEDCLYLNIWVKPNPVNSRIMSLPRDLPVMVFIYGGGFTIGSIRNEIYDGRALVAEGSVVVVTINYRMGVLGFLTSGNEEAPGNYGMYDILEALKWVNKNIAAFGGDPNQVTLVGQGSGSIAIGLLCVSPLAKGLFHRVIMQSGSPAFTLADNSIADNLLQSQNLSEIVGCATPTNTISNDTERVLRCLRGKNPFQLTGNMNFSNSGMVPAFFPVYGDEILPLNARQALIDGNFTNVSVLIGNNADEGTFLMTSYNRHYRYSDVYYINLPPSVLLGQEEPEINMTYGEQILDDTFKKYSDLREAVFEHYLGDVRDRDYRLIRREVYTALGDYSILCPTVFFAESYSRAGNDVYYYYFTHRPSISPWGKWMGTAHFDEVQFVFGHPLMNESYSSSEETLSGMMIGIWTNFVKTGSPGIDRWPRYSRENPVFMKLNAKDYYGWQSYKRYGRGPHKCNCDFFRSYFGFE